MASFFDLKARQAAAAAASSSKAPTTKPETGSLQPWVEKYRPKSLSDVNGQDHTVTVLSRTLQSSNLPHMLFYGPPGTGKTSTILALAKQLYGPDLIKTRVLELNASDERGIAIVREKVKNFARQQLSNAPPASTAYRQRHPCPPFKIVILDEADSMTQDAQSALRRTMETYSRITRFCLVCNYVTRIIDPLASRCSKFRFKSLDAGSATARLGEIAACEGVVLGEGATEALVRVSEGDLRKAITFLQSAARLVGAVKAVEGGAQQQGGRKRGAAARVVEDDDDDDDDDGDEMDVDEKSGGGAGEKTKTPVSVPVIEEIAGVIPGPTMERLYDAMQPRAKGKVYADVAQAVEDMVADGWSATQLVAQLYEMVLFDEKVEDLKKNKITLVFSETDKRLVDGADEHLEILDLCLRIAGILADG
ncbi:replication factor c subunit 2 [Diplodia corticola]|uniref:Replication factor C subunit 2 n=1 Tax=Diplodia corticola TaxID=236234 RepID=A0A1J9S5A0_9PEZI|nr:replication factor c subunit 2 [Diplodia corticola]OJD35124.1 replication factor c subunit 2 [Diplodia corticola]